MLAKVNCGCALCSRVAVPLIIQSRGPARHQGESGLGFILIGVVKRRGVAMATSGIMFQFPIPSTPAINNNPSSMLCCSLRPPKSLSVETPRRLILLRHAKSSWEDRSLRDHDRPLSNAGQADAIEVSQKLQQLGWIPEIILSSDALRTRQTLKIMQDHVRGFLEAEVHFISSFYSIAAMDGQTAEHLQQAICKYSRDEIITVMCMGHNRGWEEAASMLSGASIELKTCNAALLEATGKSWEEAFSVAGLGGWRLKNVVKPNTIL